MHRYLLHWYIYICPSHLQIFIPIWEEYLVECGNLTLKYFAQNRFRLKMCCAPMQQRIDRHHQHQQQQKRVKMKKASYLLIDFGNFYMNYAF